MAPIDAARLPDAADALLEAVAIAKQDSPAFSVIVEATENFHASLHELAARLGITDCLQLVDPNDTQHCWRECDVVIATATVPKSAVAARQASEICLKAMVGNKTLLAADVPRHRDVSPDGRGCLWFDSADPRDLGHRISFLTLNPEFRSALGAAGHAFILETRSLASIGARYDAVYRHTFTEENYQSWSCDRFFSDRTQFQLVPEPRGVERPGARRGSRSSYAFCFFSTLAHVSFNATVRLKTSLPGFESVSTQKYPRRSN